MQSFARDCVEEHYPSDLLPVWINKKEFYKCMTNIFMERIKDALHDGDSQITVNGELAFPLTSAAIDSGADAIMSYTDDLTIEIPKTLESKADLDKELSEDLSEDQEEDMEEDLEEEPEDLEEEPEELDEELEKEDEEISFDDIAPKQAAKKGSTQCQYIFRRGKNEGQHCQTKPKNGAPFCSVHSK